MNKITNDIIKSFERYLFESEKSEHTIEKYLRDIRFFCLWLGEGELTKAMVLKYKKELCERYSPASVNSILSSLNALFIYMCRYELKVRILKIQRKIFADKGKELTKGEYERLLSAAKRKGREKLYYIMQTIASTGIRISELKYITCEAVASGQATVNCKGKIRQIFLSGELCKVLKKYIKERKIKKGAVFVSRNGNPVDRSMVWKMMKELCNEANVPKSKVFPHNLRHLFARTFYSLQKDIVRLADILGHSSIETTRIYTIESGEIHKMQLCRLGLLRC